jgi:hypothetical protein
MATFTQSLKSYKLKYIIMKKLFALLFITSLLFVSCVSEPGPPGPPGPAGENGINILGQVFEAEVDFLAINGFEELVPFPDNIEVFDTDVVVAYVLTDVVDGLDVWEPLPQTLFLGNEILLYGFNYTVGDILFFLDGTVNFNNLPSDLTDNIIFRVAIIPADMAEGVNLNSLESVMSAMQNKEIMQLN